MNQLRDDGLRRVRPRVRSRYAKLGVTATLIVAPARFWQAGVACGAMLGPLHFPTVLLLYPFRFRDPVTHKWVKARYLAERHELEARYKEWEIIGEPEYRRSDSGYFSPWRSDRPRP